jgi:hypothetical protein
MLSERAALLAETNRRREQPNPAENRRGRPGLLAQQAMSGCFESQVKLQGEEGTDSLMNNVNLLREGDRALLVSPSIRFLSLLLIHSTIIVRIPRLGLIEALI